MTERRCGTCGMGEPPWNGIVQVMSLRLCDWKPTEPVPYWVNFPIRPLMGAEDGATCAAWKEKTDAR